MSEAPKRVRRRTRVEDYITPPLSLKQLVAVCRVARAALDQRDAAIVACSDTPPEDADRVWDATSEELEHALDALVSAYKEEDGHAL